MSKAEPAGSAQRHLGYSLAACLLAACFCRTAAADPAAFLQRYCFACHGEAIQEADRRFDRLSPQVTGIQELELWQDVLDQINRGDMPPADELQPSAAERVAAAEQIAQLVGKAGAGITTSGKATVLRRLNRFEYDRSIRELLALPEILVDPTDNFPPDESDHGFKNIGSTLVLSDFLLARYLEAADRYLQAATHPERQPPSQIWRFEAPFCPTGNRHDGKDRPGEYQHVRKNYYDVGGFLWLRRFAEGVPHDGNYTIRVRADAIGRDYPYPESVVKVPREDPLRMEIIAGAARYGDLDTNNTSDRLLAEFELVDNHPQWYEATVWLDAGFQPRIAFPNGPLSVKATRTRLVESYPDQFRGYIEGHVPRYNRMHPEYDPLEKDQLIAEFFAEQRKLAADGKPTSQFGISHSINTRNAWSQFFSEYEGPRIRVFEIEIEGPFYDQWPPASHRVLFGEPGEERRALLSRFAARAYRRPVPQEVVDSVLALYARELQRGAAEPDALLTAYQAILCSPGFLYLHQTPGGLDDHDLATRLSYFLWSAPPDAELERVARQGMLSQADSLRRQVDRLLDDPRAAAFVEQFTDAWLGLHKLGTMLPSQRAHPDYFVQNLERGMRRETHLFVQDALQKDRPLLEFLAGRETYLNGPLARLYGIEGISGHAHRRVHLEAPERGGLLGMASVLTATANGIETSPVVRGVWVLENLLGTPPAPPPPDVEPIEPDIRGAATIREQLAKHREVETCNACHRKIDPYGFALEPFDEIGRYRSRYTSRGGKFGRGLRIDPSGELPSGESFSGIEELRTLLADRVDLFAKNLTARMLTYATGRLPSITDRIEVDRILAGREASEIGFRQLVHDVAQSAAFLE